MRYRAVLGASLLALAASAENVAVHYKTLAPDQISRRIQDFKTTNEAREHELHHLFEEAGCNGEHLTEQPVKHSHNPNVICALPGQLQDQIVVGGHFDFVDRGQGVVDNWSGSSLLPSLYESLNGAPRRHSFVFVGFTDEEKGLVGSAFYVHQLSKDDLSRISAMVNMDSLGTTPTKVELDRADTGLLNALGLVAGSMHLPIDIVNVHQVGRSDSDSFQDRRVPAIMIHSLTNETWHILHSRDDAMAAMRLPDYYDSYRLIAAYLAYLDVTLDAAAASAR